MSKSPPTYSPSIHKITLLNGEEIRFDPASVTFIVGPNNGGKSTFLREINVDYNPNEKLTHRWIKAVRWDLGDQSDFNAFVSQNFDEHTSSFDKSKKTGATVLRAFTYDFYNTQRLGHSEYLVRTLDAQNRISLSDRVSSPDVIENRPTHPYHTFFFDSAIEDSFSQKIYASFQKNVRINRTGLNTIAHLGEIPSDNRLSNDYESHILREMTAIDKMGDGIRSYAGILLNFYADSRPVTLIDEPEAFLHPPQAYRLGKELASLAFEGNKQAIVATHSSDVIRGAISTGAPVQFIYLDHHKTERPYHVVGLEKVRSFGAEPFLAHTNALDSLFYAQAVVCEAEADIMFFKWVVDRNGRADDIENTFWIPSYGKTATPSILRSLNTLGIKAKCVFDIDVLLSADIIISVCETLNVDIERYLKFLKDFPGHIKVPPVAHALKEIENIISDTADHDSDESRVKAIKAIKKSAEGLSKSWSLKATGLRLLPKGEIQKTAKEFIEHLERHGIIILREGELENYVPDVGGHGKGWVRQAIEADQMDTTLEQSLIGQLNILIDS